MLKEKPNFPYFAIQFTYEMKGFVKLCRIVSHRQYFILSG